MKLIKKAGHGLQFDVDGDVPGGSGGGVEVNRVTVTLEGSDFSSPPGSVNNSTVLEAIKLVDVSINKVLAINIIYTVHDDNDDVDIKHVVPLRGYHITNYTYTAQDNSYVFDAGYIDCQIVDDGTDTGLYLGAYTLSGTNILNWLVIGKTIEILYT